MIVRVVKDVRNHFVLRFQEWLSTFILAQFGATLLRPGFSFSVSPSYSVMATFASENTWAVCLLVIAGLRFVALVLNGTFSGFRRILPYVRSFTAFISAFAWSSIAFGIFSANAMATGGGTYTGLMIGDFILGIIVAGEAAAVERAHRGPAAVKSA